MKARVGGALVACAALALPAFSAIGQAGFHPWCRAAARPPFLLTSDSLGPLVLGGQRASFERRCPTVRPTTWEDAEAHPIEGSAVRFGRSDVVLVEWTKSGEFERAHTETPGVRTPRGIGVGSRVRELRRVLGPLQAGYDDAIYVWSEREPHISYVVRFDLSDVLGSPDDIWEHADLIPDTARATQMVFFSR